MNPIKKGAVMAWAPAIKRSLGDVWHFDIGGNAHCDHRVRTDTRFAKDEPPADEYVCKRCRALHPIKKETIDK